MGCNTSQDATTVDNSQRPSEQSEYYEPGITGSFVSLIKDSPEADAAANTIQSAFRAHKERRERKLRAQQEAEAEEEMVQEVVVQEETQEQIETEYRPENKARRPRKGRR